MKSKMKIIIHGMSCKHCAKKVEEALKEIEKVEKVKVNLKNKEAILITEKEVEQEKIKKAIEDLDYQVLQIKEV